KTTGPIEGGTEIREPTYNLRAFWIDPINKSEAEGLGYDVVDPSTVIATHLSGVIQQNSQEIMGRQQIKNIVDTVREDNPVVVDEVLQDKKIGLGTIQIVLQNLLKENVSIRNMTRIMEAIASNADRSQGDPHLLTEGVRQTLRRQIVGEYEDSNHVLRCISVHPDVDRRLREGVHRDPEEGFIMALKPDFQQALQQSLVEELNTANEKGYFPVFLTSRAIRAGLFTMLERISPQRNFAVLAHEEIPNETTVDAVSIMNIRKAEESVA
ncbi:MAG: FHIPEP family type III secretion protein, partial [Leptonema sp. (in: Bacteria)]|nr:FHIPEP family type III secretion protein [Leptonema sp. (in: bacteria)]